MQWRSCSAALCAAMLAACLTAAQQSFLPDPNARRLSPDEWRTQATALLTAECPRLMGASRSALGEAGFTVVLDPDGGVREAILARASPDERINALFGGLTAQLAFPGAMEGGARAPLIAGYSCAPNTSVATLELNVTR